MEEIWKDIEGYEGLYQVSNIGKPVTSSNITACLKVITLTAYGYEWRYSDE